jgi:hypothetical protein
VPIAERTFEVGKVGHETLDSSSVLLLLPRACGQKPQLAMHLPSLNVIKYAVVGTASNLPLNSSRTTAVPVETRISSGKLVWFRHVFSGKGCTEINGSIMRKQYISLG